MRFRFLSASVGGLLMALIFSAPGLAQQGPSPAQLLASSGSQTVKEYGRPGYPKMTVYVWGRADTGVWNVERGTDLLEFVSVVARVQMTNNSPERRLIDKLSIYREGSRRGRPDFETRIETLFSARGSYPALQDGDILVLESTARNRFTWRDVARITGALGTFLNTYLLLERVRN